METQNLTIEQLEAKNLFIYNRFEIALKFINSNFKEKIEKNPDFVSDYQKLKKLRKENKKPQLFSYYYFLDKKGKKVFIDAHEKLMLAYFQNYPDNFDKYQQNCYVSIFWKYCTDLGIWPHKVFHTFEINKLILRS